MVVREVLPGGAVLAVVLAHRPPLALGQIRAPVVPVAALPQPVLELAEALDAVPFLAHPRSGAGQAGTCAPFEPPSSLRLMLLPPFRRRRRGGRRAPPSRGG